MLSAFLGLVIGPLGRSLWLSLYLAGVSDGRRCEQPHDRSFATVLALFLACTPGGDRAGCGDARGAATAAAFFLEARRGAAA